ncbi:LysR substrate-binding domain-containing protein [Bordetella sp. BOR01]|uniref:LysR substrate-binding domain-containing protein n=1 Tax=Bordetella sp. BOR01 TaxID=2854779 RepID=UPI001C470035|nr:LysR substrate-binding domain-containing protein [Bordetella sp. BOR01]MBV7483062.1 LysR family transcriptional regulator [Bordetella sp. BOR01]
MNLSWLEDFLALAASGNFSRAAQERHMTQPAFSRRIRALEEWLGVALFDRSTHPVSLTETGDWFRTTAQEILGRVARVPDEARAVAAAGSATLRFAATHALSLTFLPQWLRGLESRTTIGPIQLVSDMLQQCEAWMQQGRVQFLLCHTHAQAPGRLDAPAYRSLKIGTDTLVPVCAPDRAGRPRQALSANARKAVPMLAYSAESGLGRLVRALLGPALQQARVEPVFTAHLAAVLKSMALDGRGVAWLPLSMVETELHQKRLVQAGDASWRLAADIRLFRPDAALAPAAEAFWRAVLAAHEQ